MQSRPPAHQKNLPDTLRIERVDLSLTQKVVQALRNAILSGRFEPGQRLIERNLCEMTGVSRTGIREALRSLESEGLVTNIPNRGPVVASVSLKEAKDIYEVRKILETRAVELFVETASGESLELLRDCITTMEQAYRQRDFEGVHLEKRNFYSIIINSCGNELVGHILNQLYAKISLLRNVTMAQESRTGVAVEELRAIFDAIAARDVKAARRACLSHVESAAKVAIEALSREDGASHSAVSSRLAGMPHGRGSSS